MSTDAAHVSVVIPAYNAGAYLRATLESVFAQSAPPGEVIVVDDGSSDDTVAVAESFGVTVIRRSRGGASAARNAGTHAAHGTHVAFLDADDLWDPEKLARQVAALESAGQPAFSFTDFRIFDEFGVHAEGSGLWHHPAFRQTVGNARDRASFFIAANEARPVLPDMYFLPSSALVRREDVIAAGGFDERLRICEDYEFFLRLFRIVPAVAVMQPLMLYRRHSAQATASTIGMLIAHFELERLVAAAPDRYPGADVRHIANKGYLLHFRIGFAYARLGKFDEAIESLEHSLAARRTLRAAGVKFAAHAGRSPLGRFAFVCARSLRRKLARQHTRNA